MSSDLQIQTLYEALRSAAYYVDRLEKAQCGKRVRDMTEAMEGYHRVVPALIAAYEKESA